MTDWPHQLLISAVHVLGFLGLFGISLLPLRAFRALHHHASLWHQFRIAKLSLVLVGIVAVAAIAIGAALIADVIRCLTESRCGPNRASGWISLAQFGACYRSGAQRQGPALL